MLRWAARITEPEAALPAFVPVVVKGGDSAGGASSASATSRAAIGPRSAARARSNRA